MTWLELIGKVMVIGFSIAGVIIILVVLTAVIWLYYEQSQGRNPFL